jgi:hypothetical protein
MFDVTSRTRRAVAGVLALAVIGAGVGGAVSAATASNTAPVTKVAPATPTPKAPTSAP